jgi:hypothetical protein
VNPQLDPSHTKDWNRPAHAELVSSVIKSRASAVLQFN